jgi:hypothetical protein
MMGGRCEVVRDMQKEVKSVIFWRENSDVPPNQRFKFLYADWLEQSNDSKKAMTHARRPTGSTVLINQLPRATNSQNLTTQRSDEQSHQSKHRQLVYFISFHSILNPYADLSKIKPLIS